MFAFYLLFKKQVLINLINLINIASPREGGNDPWAIRNW